MISALKTTDSLKLLLMTLNLLLFGCSLTPEQQAVQFDPTAVKNIRFEFEQAEAFFGLSLPLQEINKQVSDNLVDWGYPLNQDSEAVSHLMTAIIAKQIHSSTPTGFSFSAGNSDPRSLDFQKATVLPITCYLSPLEHSDQSAELTLEVMANDYLTIDKQPKSSKNILRLITDDLSTACFNLLSSLKVNKQKQPYVEGNLIQPSWIPDTRIEIEQAGEESSVVDPSKSDSTPSSSEPRKRIIIHNEGSPVIFKFGHERK